MRCTRIHDDRDKRRLAGLAGPFVVRAGMAVRSSRDVRGNGFFHGAEPVQDENPQGRPRTSKDVKGTFDEIVRTPRASPSQAWPTSGTSGGCDLPLG